MRTATASAPIAIEAKPVHSQASDVASTCDSLVSSTCHRVASLSLDESGIVADAVASTASDLSFSFSTSFMGGMSVPPACIRSSTPATGSVDSAISGGDAPFAPALGPRPCESGSRRLLAEYLAHEPLVWPLRCRGTR